MNTVKVGDGFRDEVAALLGTRYLVKREFLLGGTKIDLLFDKDVFAGDPEPVAVECKNYKGPLTKHQLATEIWPTYGSLLQTHKKLRLLIVSKHSLGAAAAEYLRETMVGASHRTFDELAEELLDLRGYVRSLADTASLETTEYIEGRFTDGNGTAFEQIQCWAQSDGRPGMAVLGGYGQGKSSLATRVARHYAREHVKNASGRIPVLIRLGMLVHEIHLEGLFAKEFTYAGVSRSFTFPTFMHLNAIGRLLIILDGFDEMKHAMSPNDLRASFLQFNRLLVGQARVLLLGRPNSLRPEEDALFLHGRKQIGDDYINSAEYQPWEIRRLRYFDNQESRQLLSNRIRRLLASKERAKDKTDLHELEVTVAERVDHVEAHVEADLIRRPVHVVLVSELAADTAFDFTGFNAYKLYDYFIASMVMRDTNDKPARAPISHTKRLLFQRELAWWAWTRPSVAQGWFYRAEIPARLIDGLPGSEEWDRESYLNEYVVATLTEVKEGGALAFAHRSFQEFLVATRMIANPPSALNHSDYARVVNAEVAGFLTTSSDQTFWQSWFKTLLDAKGPLTLSYIELFARQIGVTLPSCDELIAGEAKFAPVVPLLTMLTLRIDSRQQPSAESLLTYYCECIAAGNETTAVTAAVAALVYIGRLQDAIGLDRVIGAVVTRCIRNSRSADISRTSLSVDLSARDTLARWLSERATKDAGKLYANFFSFGQVLKDDLTMSGQFLAGDQLVRAMLDELPKTAFQYPPRDLKLIYKHIPKALHDEHKVFLYRNSRNFQLTFVSSANPNTRSSARAGGIK